ncbi:hypothetical protein HMPREF0005_02909 [Achromobacter xylosoxidans C54]|uniref:protein-export chaperone SecB n=1 Tax=Alcaligenes xylosoxydans xylosoxydans TaxID=85698 RepID=UPI0001F439D3|nr:protein-export chaperone SecB [Achromobacter xylosoxidans]EFV84167.1 hypothetical protein HMPREF0005_02909 [Achromobacter xylosoxidans C54]
MNPTTLPLDRLEFLSVNIVACKDYKREDHGYFPQIDFTFDDSVRLGQRSSLGVDDEENPRFFVFEFAIKLTRHDESATPLPYEVEVAARGFFRYTGDSHEGVDRFRAVRVSGYSILYGAIREMVSTITARSAHGLLQLPAMNFHSLAKNEAESDEQARQEVLAKLKSPEAKTIPASPKKTASPKRIAAKRKATPT